MNKKYIISVMGLVECLIVYLALCVATISYKSELFEFLAISLFVIVAIIFFFMWKKLFLITEFSVYFEQVHILNIGLGVLLTIILLRDLSNIHFPGYQKVIIVMFFILTLICEIFYVKYSGIPMFHDKIIMMKLSLKNNIGLGLVISFFILLSVYSGGTPYKWDSNLYYITCQKLNAFSISNLAIYGHIAQTFGLFMKLGTVILGAMIDAAYVSNVFVAIFGIIFFYKILRYVCPQVNSIELCLATSVYAFSSYTLGLVNYLSLDYYCACIFPAVVYFMLKEKWVFHVLFAWFFCFTKEPAIIIYAGLCLAYLWVSEYHNIKINGLKSFKKIIMTVQYWYMVLIGVLWYVTYRLLGPWSAGDGGITIDLGYIWEKIKVMYILNFGWFFSIIYSVTIVGTCLFNKKKNYCIYIFLWVPLLVYTLFSCLFQTANHYRYNAIVMFCLCCVSMTFVLTWEKKNLRRIMLGISCIISLCSSYISIDPISNQLFDSVETGNGYVWTTSGIGCLGDSAIYNKQALLAENALNASLHAAIDENDEIILQAQNDNIWYADGLTEFVSMENDAYVYSFWWDEQLSQRVNAENDFTKQIAIVQVNGIEGIEQIVDMYEFDKTYSYIALDDDNEVFSQIQNEYCVIENKEFECANWKYRMVRFKK